MNSEGHTFCLFWGGGEEVVMRLMSEHVRLHILEGGFAGRRAVAALNLPVKSE